MMNQALSGDKTHAGEFHKFFATYVVGASPMGVAGGSNDSRFQEAIRQGIDFYIKIGISSMNISFMEIT